MCDSRRIAHPIRAIHSTELREQVLPCRTSIGVEHLFILHNLDCGELPVQVWFRARET
jgi:hypothetical protein